MGLISRLGKKKADTLRKNNTKTYQELIFKMLGFELKGEEYLLNFKSRRIYRHRDNDKLLIGIEARAGGKWPSKRWDKYNQLEEILASDGFEIKFFQQRAAIYQYIPKVSVVVLTKNAQRFIGSTLKSIFEQDSGHDFEVIVIDSGSVDKTIEIVKNYPVNLVQILPEEFGHGKTRNLAVQFSRGEYVVFLNGDAMPKDSHWLDSLIKNFYLYEDAAGVYSRISPRQNCNPLDARDIIDDTYLFDKKIKCIESIPGYFKISPEEKRKFISFHTISCAIRRELLLENAFADIPFGEDLEWSKRMLEKGFKIVFEADSRVIHSHNHHHSFINTMKRSFDDARLSQFLLNRWDFLNLIKWPFVIINCSLKDVFYIIKLKRNIAYKLIWSLYTPFGRLAEFIGIMLGLMKFLPINVVKKLSLVEQIRRR